MSKQQNTLVLLSTLFDFPTLAVTLSPNPPLFPTDSLQFGCFWTGTEHCGTDE